MNNMNRYDYEASDANVDKAALAAEREKRRTTKRRMLFVLTTVICHLVALAVYLVVFANTGDFQSYYDETEERIVLIIFGVLAVAVFGALNAIGFAKDTDAREYFIKDRPFSRKKRITLAKREVIPFAVIYAAFQLPAAIFHLIAGFDYVETSIFEYFYVLDMGLMELTRVGFIGAVINAVIFAVSLFLTRLYICRRWQADEEKFEKVEKMKRKYG
jgi:hypothetical protein